MPVELTADPAVVLAVARHRLPGTPAGIDGGRVEVADEAWAPIGGTIAHQRLTGLAALALADGQLVLGPDATAHLTAEDRRVQAQAVRAERVTLDVSDGLRDLGVRHAVLKGPAFAHTCYPDPATRPFVDVDVLVPATDLDRVVRHLEAHGAVRHRAQLAPGFDRRFAKSVTLRHPDGVELDVHRSLALGPLAHLVRPDDLTEGLGEVEPVPGRPLPVLHPDLAFLHACVHAAVSAPVRWLSVRDVVATEPAADLDRCRAVAAGWRATGVVLAATELVRARGLPMSDRLRAWAADLRPTAAERRVAAAYDQHRVGSRRLTATGLRYVRGPRDKVAYTWALVRRPGNGDAAR